MYITCIKYVHNSNKNSMTENKLNAKLLALATAVNLSLIFINESRPLQIFYSYVWIVFKTKGKKDCKLLLFHAY
jgi:hypothetical protein